MTLLTRIIKGNEYFNCPYSVDKDKYFTKYQELLREYSLLLLVKEMFKGEII